MIYPEKEIDEARAYLNQPTLEAYCFFIAKMLMFGRVFEDYLNRIYAKLVSAVGSTIETENTTNVSKRLEDIKALKQKYPENKHLQNFDIDSLFQLNRIRNNLTHHGGLFLLNWSDMKEYIAEYLGQAFCLFLNELVILKKYDESL